MKRSLLTLILISCVPVVLSVYSLMAQTELSDPRIVIRKSARTLELLDGDKLIKTYKIRLGFAPRGDKEVEGDGRTPEGDFYVFFKNDKSKFTASLGVSYPDVDDARRGLTAGLLAPEEAASIVSAINAKEMPLQKTRLGGEIYIHGGGTNGDWTDGCVALEDKEMLELFALAKETMPVRILP